MEQILDLPSVLKVRIASFLSPRDAVRLSHASKRLYEDLALAQIPMHIPFKSWYDDLPSTNATTTNASMQQSPKQGPKIPFLPHRTHSITLTGSWSCRLGELQGRHYGANSQAQFFIVAYPLDNCGNPYDESEPEVIARRTKGYEGANANHHSMASATRSALDQEEEHPSWLSGGGRIVWASRPLCQRHYQQSNNSSWVKLTVTFVPSKDEEYYLCVQAGPGTASHQQWWRHSLHMSNLIAHITFHDNPHSNFLMKRQYKSIVKHILKVENRGAYYTNLLEATARSIRIQLARFGRNALDPVLESFFQSTGIPRDTDSLLVLEEIARFLSYYAYVNERRRKFNNSNTERESVKEGGANSSVPDWIPYAESSVANRSSRGGDFSYNANDDNYFGGPGGAAGGYMKDDSYVRDYGCARANPTVPTVPEQQEGNQQRRSGTRRLQRTVQHLLNFPSSLWRSSGKGKTTRRRRRSGRPSWRTDEVTEEFSISVVPPEEVVRSPFDQSE